MSTRRIYLVNDLLADDGRRYLVRAGSAAQALRHVTTGHYKAKVADQEELVAAFNDKLVVENAGEETADETDTAGA